MDDADAAAEIVSVVLAAAPAGVTVSGEKLQVAPEGSPLHSNVTVELNPFCGATETETVPLPPSPMLSDGGVADKLKVSGRFIV